MDHLVGAVALDRIDDRDRLARGEPQHAAVPGLAAARRIKHGAVEPDAAPIGADDPRRAAAQIPVIAKQQLGHLS